MAKATKDSMDARHRAVYEEYLKVLESHGKYGKFMPKMKLYEEVAEKTFYEVNTVCRILRTQMKMHSSSSIKSGDQLHAHADYLKNHAKHD